jgi:hypothetical protein
MQTIKIAILPDGKVDLGIHGIKGIACEEIMQAVARHLGPVIATRHTEEYFEQEIVNTQTAQVKGR